MSWLLNLLLEPYVPGKQKPPGGLQSFTTTSLNGGVGRRTNIAKKEGFITGLYYYFKHISRQN
jgi:hypothetical protein